MRRSNYHINNNNKYIKKRKGWKNITNISFFLQDRKDLQSYY